MTISTFLIFSSNLKWKSSFLLNLDFFHIYNATHQYRLSSTSVWKARPIAFCSAVRWLFKSTSVTSYIDSTKCITSNYRKILRLNWKMRWLLLHIVGVVYGQNSIISSNNVHSSDAKSHPEMHSTNTLYENNRRFATSSQFKTRFSGWKVMFKMIADSAHLEIP